MSKTHFSSGGLAAATALLAYCGAALAQPDLGIPARASSARQMTAAGAALVASLRPEQRERIVLAFTGENRTNWSNVPVYVHARPGLRIRDLTTEQRRAAHALMRASLSSQGYQKLAGVLRLDSIHRARELGALERRGPLPGDRPFVQLEAESFGAGSYGIAIFGMPGRDENWGWIIQGHHLGASFTVSGDRAGFTPLFLGATPLVLEDGVLAGYSAMSHEVARGVELMASLSAAQRARAVEPGDVPSDVLYGVGRKGEALQGAGLSAADMTPAQRRLLRALVEEYVRNADFDVAEAQLDAIAWNELSFAWRGPSDEPGAAFYYRVYGERILIELAHRPNHIHTIVRDPANDYGERWIGQTYSEAHSAADRFDAAVRAYRAQ